MKIRDIIGSARLVRGDGDGTVSSVTYDSRQVSRGDLFVAIRGERSDGHAYIGDAIGRGAAAVAFEKGAVDLADIMSSAAGVTWIEAPDTREALASFSSLFYGRPSDALTVVGITGTNGKTTTSYLLKSVIERWGKKAGLIGTIRYLIGREAFDAPHTTPEASDFQRLLRSMADAGCSHVVAEVSSHGLTQRRADCTRFSAAVFTNLTRDHLDFHGTMEEYFTAKERLFTELLDEGGCAVVNVDDPYGQRLVAKLRDVRRDVSVLTYGITNKEAGLTASEMKTGVSGTSFRIDVRDREGRCVPAGLSAPGDAPGSGGKGPWTVASSLVGRTNVYNMLAAIAASYCLGIPPEVVRDGISSAGAVDGRFEKVDAGQEFLAVVDYAHTGDALERLITTARQLLENGDGHCPVRRKEPGRIITVFGCGGDRDRGKRPVMGKIAAELSDFVIVTSDNPRFEDPGAIIADIEKGMQGDRYVVVPDRNTAISLAVGTAGKGDIVLVAGKGHEDYQEVRGVRTHFSDREAIQAAVKRRGGHKSPPGDRTGQGNVAA
ncbi:MAG TPA: UDP-N-acetylmuramoyl-L-alanyl-D-glutamate--2,6-diaminopimelate ligase [Dissulfurispiraceae bacterium]|nr:UDP-N-acetylmuramoyl-L-alanyl-D-glutamate--2,6-diaminopimelate ligase [Dissulfurispiraceae bacterium]